MTGEADGVARSDGLWGTFLIPDQALSESENLHEALDVSIKSGYRADLTAFAGMNAVFDNIATAIGRADVAYEDQCSAQHYFDIFGCVKRFQKFASDKPAPRGGVRKLIRGRASARGTPSAFSAGEVQRVVDVGVFMGGSAAVFAGCLEPMNLELDLVDVNQTYLQFTYERLRRIFPGVVSKIRMFYGDLPTYVRNVLLAEDATRTFVHHDGSHDFCQVVKDLGSLYFARDRVHSLAIQDTHLRCSNVDFFNFVDSAVYAIFGAGVSYDPLGSRYDSDSPMTNPNQYEGNYFLAGQSEGMYIPFARNKFKYPHPMMSLEAFLPPQARIAQ